MELVSACPLPVAPLFWQPRPGAFCLTVVCKATFLLEPSRARLAPVQEPVRDADAWSAEGARASLRFPSDLVPAKPRADVVLVGHAFAPSGEPVRALTARLVVGTLDKAIEVICDRSITRDGAVREGAPFAKMPLVYERAAGGPETWNPIGLRSDAWSAEGHLALPNLQPRGKRAAGAFEPMGFGPIPPAWPLRRDRLGRHAALADAREWRCQPLPADMDLGYFNVAPPDQQIAAIDDDVRIALEHLHPERLLLVTRLPGVRPKALVDRPGHAPQRVVLQADTLWIDTDRALCTVTYRGQVPLSHPDEAGRVLVTLMRAADEQATGPETPRAPPRRSSVPPPPASGEEAEEAPGERTTMPRAVEGPTLPFVPTPSFAPGAPSARSLGLPFQRSHAPGPGGESPTATWTLRPAPLPLGPWEDETPAPPTVDFVPTMAPPPPTIAPPPPTISPPSATMAPQAPTISPPSSLMGPQPPTMAPPPPLVRAPAPAPVSTRTAADPPAPSAAKAACGFAEGEVMQLVWYAPEGMPLIRRRKSWKAILDEADAQPIDPELGDPALSAKPAEAEHRRDLAAILVRGEPVGLEALGRVISEGIHGRAFTPKMALVGGELVFPFDELGVLRALVLVATPLAAEDERLRAAVRAAGDFVGMPGAESAPSVAEGLGARIREILRQGRRGVALDVLEAQVERAALEQRAYQKRMVFGGMHLRGVLVAGAGAAVQSGVPVYLPERLSAELPLYQRFKARILAEVWPQVDQGEAQAVALRGAGLGRILGFGRK